MKQDISAAIHKAGNAGRGESYYIEIDPTFYTATSKTFIGAEFSLFGMRDVADPAGRLSAYPQISAEFILKTNPDYVFLADTVCCQQTAASFAHRPGFSVLAAVRLHHVIGVNDSVASEWGPHTIEAFVALLAGTLRS
jgi:iron complex transport system substrate-binding protein